MKKIFILLLIFLFSALAKAENSNNEPIEELQEAIQKGRIEIVEDYIDKGLVKNPSINSIYIFYAVAKHQSEIVKLLLKEGVSPDSKFKNVPILFFALHNNDNEILNILLSYGANPDNDINNPLFGNKNMSPLTYAIIKKNLTAVKLLVNFKADVNKISYGELPLATAIRYKQIDIVEFLLKNNSIKDESVVRALKKANSKIKSLFD